MSSFAFTLGVNAAKERLRTGVEKTEPPISGELLDEWRRGYGGRGTPCPSKTNAGSAADSAASVPSQSLTGRDSRTGSASGAVAPARKQAALFDPGEPVKPKREKPATEPQPKPPTPVPLDEVQEEINLLVSIGIGLSEADDLVRRQQWTLDQMVCQWKLGNEAGLPQHVIGRVARYGQQRWGAKLEAVTA